MSACVPSATTRSKDCSRPIAAPTATASTTKARSTESIRSSFSTPLACAAELLPCISGNRERLVPSPGLVDSLKVEHRRIQRQIEEMRSSLRVLESVIEAANNRSHSDEPDP